MKSARYHEDALAELHTAAEWYERQRSGLGRDFVTTVEKGVTAIRRSPTAFALHDAVSIRRYVLNRFPYLILYEEVGDFIWVIAVAHQRRDPDYWKYRQVTDQ